MELTSEEIDTLLAMAGYHYFYSKAFKEGAIMNIDYLSGKVPHDRVDYKGLDTEETKLNTFIKWRDR